MKNKLQIIPLDKHESITFLIVLTALSSPVCYMKNLECGKLGPQPYLLYQWIPQLFMGQTVTANIRCVPCMAASVFLQVCVQI